MKPQPQNLPYDYRGIHVASTALIPEIPANSGAVTPSSLLLPDSGLEFFQMRKQQFGSIRAYFSYLLVRYVRMLPRLGIIPEKTPSQWKTRYQKAGQKLAKLSFLPDPRVWEAYRQTASRYGLSICHLFVILMQLDKSDWLEAGRPENCPKTPALPPIQKNRKNYAKKGRKRGNRAKKLDFISISVQMIDFERYTLTRTGFFR
jgi:hypothetical protein